MKYLVIIALLFMFTKSSFGRKMMPLKPLKYKIETLDTTNTYLQIFFIDKEKKEQIWECNYRLMNNDIRFSKEYTMEYKKNMPIPIALTSSNYNLFFRSYQIENINIQKNKLTKLYIQLEPGYLICSYYQNTEKEVPFDIVIRKKGNNMDSIVKRANEKITLETGKYVLHLKSIPPAYYNTEIHMDGITEIQIKEEGILSIALQNFPKVEIEIFFQNGNGYTTLLKNTLEASKVPFKLELSPRNYKIVTKYISSSNEVIETKTQLITIVSNETEEIKL